MAELAPSSPRIFSPPTGIIIYIYIFEFENADGLGFFPPRFREGEILALQYSTVSARYIKRAGASSSLERNLHMYFKF